MKKSQFMIVAAICAATFITATAYSAESTPKYVERVVQANQVSLWTESFGNPSDTPILLISGAGSQCITWSDEFCEALAKNRNFVIRFDNRDIGKSTLIEYNKNPYTLDDMAKDAITILDDYKISKAHIVGHSMGGFIGQLIAIHYPDRILSLVSMMSSPDHSVTMAAVSGKQTTGFKLPPPDPEAMKIWQELRAKPAATREEIITSKVAGLKLSAGKGFNEKECREHEEKVYERTRDFKSVFNHWAAMSASPGRIELLKSVKTPTLVIHGGCDVVLPQEHGIETAKAIPNSKITIIPEMGHIICKQYQDKLVILISEHIANNK